MINQNRLAIYSLLSKNKICQYIKNESLKVLIIGNSKDLITETTKAVLWCCKYPFAKLEITIASKKAYEYLKAAVDHTDILEYSRKDNVFFFSKAISGNVDTVLQEINMECDFAIVACEDANYSNQMYERLKEKYVSDTISEYYDENDLLRIAYNINFCYALTYNDRESYDKAKQDLDSNEYNMNSSLAQAAHIAYRNYYCEELKKKELSEEETTAELAKFEHERWNRYEISEGFSPVAISELNSFYLKNSSHKDLKTFKHACICDYGKAENVLETNPIIWDKYNNVEKILSSDLSELDKVSLICYISSKREKKINFKTYDYQLVLMSGFCEWYKKEYSTAIVVCSDNCYKDIIIPTSTMPENILLIIPKDANVDYQRIIGDYLRGRNINTKIKTVSIDYKSFNIDNTSDIEAILKASNVESCFSCVSPGVDPNVVAAFSMHSYFNSYPCLTYSNGKITPVSSELSINHNMDRFSMTTKEFLDLNNCVYKNEENKPFISYEECMEFSDIFFKNSKAKEHSYTNNYGKKETYYYTIWTKLVTFFHKAKEQISPDEKVIIDCRYEFDNMQHLNYELKGPASKLFNCLKENRFIHTLSLDNFPQVSFTLGEDIDKWKSLLTKSGELFELYVYYKMKYSKLFNDVQTGVEIIYNMDGSDEIEVNQPHDNEIDVIAFNGFIPVLVSCKSIVNYSDDSSSGNKAIYEIASEARQFNGIPVLAVSRTLSGIKKEKINAGAEQLIKRAKICGVHLLDANILCNKENFEKAMEIIVSEKGLVSPEDFD